jgi:hypothetical protein
MRQMTIRAGRSAEWLRPLPPEVIERDSPYDRLSQIARLSSIEPIATPFYSVTFERLTDRTGYDEGLAVVFQPRNLFERISYEIWRDHPEVVIQHRYDEDEHGFFLPGREYPWMSKEELANTQRAIASSLASFVEKAYAASKQPVGV